MKTSTKKTVKKTTRKQVTVKGMMTFGQTEKGMHIMDFECCEDVEQEAYISKCKVQTMRDGNVYITEQPRRTKNKPIFREDNSSLTLGKDGRYYFVFTMPEQLVTELPSQLIRQASAIAQKVLHKIINC